MIAEFTVENFRSFKERSTFSLLATSEKELLEQNTFEAKRKVRLLKTAVFYGANASGKSNFFKALDFFRHFAVFSGPKKQVGDMIKTEVFALSKQSVNIPSTFEMIFFIQKDGVLIRYRYGFSVTQKEVISEYLYAINKVREVTLFERINQDITINRDYFNEGSPFKKAVRHNCAFLSICAQNNGEIATIIVSYLKQLHYTSGSQKSRVLKNYMDNQFAKNKIVDFLKYADIHINNIDVRHADDIKQKELVFSHTLFDNEIPRGDVLMSAQSESKGTLKLLSYSNPIFYALENGTALFIDEFDAQLHPLIIQAIVKLFNSPVQNPYNSQLIISCHSVNILSNENFRRDQIWFCSKDEFGASELYSLAEYKVRNDASYNKDYLLGKYGAIPYIDEINLKLESKADGA